MTLSSRVYRTALLLYPADLRREFGDDMAAAFAEDISHSGNIAARLRVWRCCFIELLRIAIPAQKDNPLVMVPVFAFLAATAWDGIGLVQSLRQLRLGEGPFTHMPLSEIIGSWFIPSLVVAFVGFVVARFGKPNFTSISLR
jgi:hypothetical protein